MKKEMMKMRYFIIGITLLITVAANAAPKPFTHRLIYSNLGMQSRGIDSCIGRMRAAASLGYNGFVAINWEDNVLEKQNAAFIANVKRAVTEAKRLGISLIPRHFHQADIAYNDFNLAEAFPVRGTQFVVSGNKATAVGDHETGLKNGDFESYTGNKPTGWELVSMPGAVIEKTGAKSGNACLKITGGGPWARIKQTVKLKPFRAYRLSAYISTKGFSSYSSVKFWVSGSQPLLGKASRPFGTPRDALHDGVWTTVSPNQSWRLSQTDFNSLRSTSATVELAISLPGKSPVGTIWLDDVKLEEVGLYETVRRKNCPIVVKSLDGTKTYKEGTDYVVDPKCNTFTVKSFWYQGHLNIPENSPIVNGEKLSVSWYQMSDVVYVNPEANFCIPETWAAARHNVQQMDKYYENSNAMVLGYDEWKTAFWDDRCELFPKARTAGDYMAGTLQKTTELLWQEKPARHVYIWNDMYDVYHNAHWPYYAMTNGGAQYSWRDMDTNIIVINWNACGMPWYERSVRFYMGLDDSLNPDGKVYRQVLNVMDAGRVGTWLNVVEKAEKQGGRGVIGINYVDWFANYSQMAAIKNACLARGRWGKGPIPDPNPVVVSTRRESPQARGLNTPLSVRSCGAGSIGFTLGMQSAISLDIIDVHGKTVKNLASGRRSAGKHQVRWDSASMPAGVYFARLCADGIGERTIKHVVVK